MIASLVQDVSYAIRMLRAKPGFTVAALLTLALSIGANTAIFSVFDAVLVKPMPYPAADRLVVLSERPPSGVRNSVSPATFFDWQERAHSFSGVAAASTSTATIVERDRATSVAVRLVTSNYFAVLGIDATVGRTLRVSDDEPGANAVVMTDYAWRSRFGSDPAIVGRTLNMNGLPQTIVGVLGANAAIDGAQIEVFAPLGIARTSARRDSHFLSVFARLAAAASIESAQSEMDLLARAIGRENPVTNRDWGAAVDPLGASLVGASLRQSLLVLLGAVGLILLIGCANVANLTLARSASRRKELAIRAALGASRLRIVRQLLIESLALSVCSAAVAVLIGGWLLRLLTTLMPAGLLPAHARLTMDVPVIAFTGLLALATAVLVGIVPAVVSARSDVADALKQESRGAGTSSARRRLRSLLVIGETAMATALLVGASLLVVSLVRLLGVDPGFDPNHVLAMRVSLPAGRYPTALSQSAFHRAALERIAALPGVEHAAMSTSLPLRGWLFGEPFEVEGNPVEKPRRPFAHFQSVTPDYFRTLGLPLTAGRAFATTDDDRGRPVAIVNRTLAERFFVNASPLGHHLVFDTGVGATSAPGTRWEIVGVVGRVKIGSLADIDNNNPEIYVPMAQVPVPAAWITVRSASDPLSLASVTANAIAGIDRALPLTRVSTMTDAVDASAIPARFRMSLLAALATLALVLSAVGIYGVRSYTVGERVPEIGVRMALGASPSQIRRLMLREGVWLIGSGVLLGIGLASLLSRSLATLLYGVSAFDPLVFLVAAALMIVVGLVATELPARRAARIDPVEALSRG